MPAASDPSRGLSGASPGDPTTLVQRPTALTSADLRHGLLARDRIRSPTQLISPLVALTQMGEIGAPPWVISSAVLSEARLVRPGRPPRTGESSWHRVD